MNFESAQWLMDDGTAHEKCNVVGKGREGNGGEGKGGPQDGG